MAKKRKEEPSGFAACEGSVRLVLVGQEGGDGRFILDQGGFHIPMDGYRQASVMVADDGTRAFHLIGDPNDTTYVEENGELVMYSRDLITGKIRRGQSFSACQDVLVPQDDSGALVSNRWEETNIS